MENIIKIGTVELYESDAERLCDEGKFLLTYSKIYQLKRRGGRVVGHVVHTSKGGMTHRGRFHIYSAEDVNDLVGRKIV